jgi:hypothetical protein
VGFRSTTEQALRVRSYLWGIHVSTTHVFFDPNTDDSSQNCLCDLPHQERFYGLHRHKPQRMTATRDHAARKLPVAQAFWHLKTIESFRSRYIQYAVKELGFAHLIDGASMPLEVENGAQTVDSSTIHLPSSFLVLPRPDGVILLEISSWGDFLNISVSTMDSRRLARLIDQRLFIVFLFL